MTSTVDWLHKLRAAGFTDDQAEAIAAGQDERYASRDFLDARLGGLENKLVVWMVSLTLGTIAVVIGAAFTILSRLPR